MYIHGYGSNPKIPRLEEFISTFLVSKHQQDLQKTVPHCNPEPMGAYGVSQFDPDGGRTSTLRCGEFQINPSYGKGPRDISLRTTQFYHDISTRNPSHDSYKATYLSRTPLPFKGCSPIPTGHGLFGYKMLAKLWQNCCWTPHWSDPVGGWNPQKTIINPEKNIRIPYKSSQIVINHHHNSS